MSSLGLNRFWARLKRPGDGRDTSLAGADIWAGWL